MIKRFCDACGKEVTRLHKFEYAIHLDAQDVNSMYVDSEGNGTSGRSEVKEVCQKCYNRIMSAAIVEFKEIQIEEAK